MENAKAIFKNAWPYQKDKMNLPVPELESSLLFYETVMQFRVASRINSPYRSAILERDGIQIGLAENGGDPAQDGCFFEVDNVEAAVEEFKSAGLKKEISGFKIEHHGTNSWKVFYLIAPDGLCYCLGERQG